jgi:hypothetical protein
MAGSDISGNYNLGGIVVPTFAARTVTFPNTVQPGYNDIGLYDTSLIAPDILWYQLIPHC